MLESSLNKGVFIFYPTYPAGWIIAGVWNIIPDLVPGVETIPIFRFGGAKHIPNMKKVGGAKHLARKATYETFPGLITYLSNLCYHDKFIHIQLSSEMCYTTQNTYQSSNCRHDILKTPWLSSVLWVEWFDVVTISVSMIITVRKRIVYSCVTSVVVNETINTMIQ